MKKPNISDRITMEQMLYSRFVKYTSLKKIIDKEFAGSSATVINIFIDLYSLYTRLYNCSKYTSPFCISAASINYCAHLRSFFRNLYGVESNIVLIYSSNNCVTNKMFIPTYNQPYERRIANNEFVTTLIINNLSLLDILVPYLPNIYYKTGSADTSVIIKYMIDQNVLPDVPNLVISDSVPMYQLPCNAKNTVVIRKRVYEGEDCSYSYSNIDCLDWFVSETKNLNISAAKLRQNLITSIFAMAGSSKIGIKQISGIRSIKTAIDIANMLPYGYERDPKALYEIYSKYSNNPIQERDFLNRFLGVDILFQTSKYASLPEANMKKFIVNTRDPDTVKMINNKYFANSPIDLERL